MRAANFRNVKIRTHDLARSAAFLSLYGMRASWMTPLPVPLASLLFGENAALPRIRMCHPDSMTGVVLVETSAGIAKLQEFTEGGYGIDFYTSDIETSVKFSAPPASFPAPPVKWKEDGVEIVEARAVDPSGTYAVFLPMMHPQSRLHFSRIDGRPDILHSELCMTSWIVPDSLKEEECSYWGETLGMRTILDTEMDAMSMQDLMGHSRPERMTSLQFAYENSACLVDILTYPDIEIERRSYSTGAVCALEIEVDREDFDRLVDSSQMSLADSGEDRYRVGLAHSPSGIPVHFITAFL